MKESHTTCRETSDRAGSDSTSRDPKILPTMRKELSSLLLNASRVLLEKPELKQACSSPVAPFQVLMVPLLSEVMITDCTVSTVMSCKGSWTGLVHKLTPF